MLRVVSWNCHYGFTMKKAAAIAKYDPDILVVQECGKEDFDAQKSEWKYGNWYWDDLNNEKSNLGVAVFSHEYEIKFTSEFDRNCRYVIPYHMKGKEKEFVLFAVWTKSGYENYHMPIYKAMDSYGAKLNMPMIIIGDFNTGRNEKESNEKWYTDLVGKLNIQNLKDCNIKKAPTFFHYFSVEHSYQNDYCFASAGFAKAIRFETGEPEEWIKPCLSDHCPIIVDFDI